MGNKAKRKKLAAEFKKHGFTLYKGSKKRAWTYWSSANMDQALFALELKTGDMANDCDNYNYEIKSPPILVWEHLWKYSIPGFDKCVKQDGSWFCGCGPPGPPKTRTEIEKDLRDYHLSAELLNYYETQVDDDYTVYYIARLRRGDPIVDEKGQLLPELLKYKNYA